MFHPEKFPTPERKVEDEKVFRENLEKALEGLQANTNKSKRFNRLVEERIKQRTWDLPEADKKKATEKLYAEYNKLKIERGWEGPHEKYSRRSKKFEKLEDELLMNCEAPPRYRDIPRFLMGIMVQPWIELKSEQYTADLYAEMLYEEMKMKEDFEARYPFKKDKYGRRIG